MNTQMRLMLAVFALVFVLILIGSYYFVIHEDLQNRNRIDDDFTFIDAKKMSAKRRYRDNEYITGDTLVGMLYFEKGEIEEALELFRAEADNLNQAAQNILGVMHKEGILVTQDFSKSASFFRQAAENGHPGAQFNLALMYEDGISVSQDWVLAYALYNLASAKGLESAILNRRILMKKLTKEQIAEGQKISSEWSWGDSFPTRR